MRPGGREKNIKKMRGCMGGWVDKIEIVVPVVEWSGVGGVTVICFRTFLPP